MKKILIVVIVVVIGAVCVWELRERRGPAVPPTETPTETKEIAQASSDPACPRPASVKSGRNKPSLDLSTDDEDDNRTPEERKLAADIEKALDDEDFGLAKRCAPIALESKDVAIRQSMVDTLGWFGEKALPELTPFLADPDEGVAESAMNEWETAVSSIEDDKLKIGVVEMAMQVISDEDGLESIANEYIGVDEKLAVESLVRIIEGGGNAKGISRAKETYEFVTGDEYAGREAAEKWIAEEYQPPEDP